MLDTSQPLDEPTQDRAPLRSLSLGVALILLGGVLNVAWILALLWLGAYWMYAIVW